MSALLAGLPAHWLGPVPFEDAVAANERAVQIVAVGGPGQVLLFEPARAVYTLGRRACTPAGRAEVAATVRACAARGIPALDVDRGGLGTLHLPGQIVLFVAAPCPRTELRRLVAELLEAARATAAGVGVEARVDLDAAVGLWTPTGKLASLGLRERRGVVGHGLALNVATPRLALPSLRLCGSDATVFACLRDLAPGAAVPPLAGLAATLARHLDLAAWPATADPAP